MADFYILTASSSDMAVWNVQSLGSEAFRVCTFELFSFFIEGGI